MTSTRAPSTAVTQTANSYKPPSMWEWIVFWVLNKLHAGFPLLNWLMGYRPQWTPVEMGDKTGQVSCGPFT